VSDTPIGSGRPGDHADLEGLTALRDEVRAAVDSMRAESRALALRRLLDELVAEAGSRQVHP
jgi:hypothetical protein